MYFQTSYFPYNIKQYIFYNHNYSNQNNILATPETIYWYSSPCA
jgi:hypothetical protein